jgi:hypothetical protein
MIDMPYRNYFYDMFGGILVLKGSSGMTHVFAHIYGNQLFNKLDFNWKDCYMEQKAADRFPIFCWKSKMKEVSSGEHIGFTGDSGHSSGPHCHYEVHQGFVWQDWAKRLDPERFVWEAFR